jgi:hypothetical protein
VQIKKYVDVKRQLQGDVDPHDHLAKRLYDA